MPFTVTPTIEDVLTDIVNFCKSIVPANIQVIRGIQNRVPAPTPTPGFVVVTPLFQERLAYNFDSYTGSAPTTQQNLQSVRVDVQIDVYSQPGAPGGSWAAMLTTLWKDEYACSLMQNCQPLYMDDARMVPLQDSERQYEQRWSMTATAEYDPVVTITQGFADELAVELVDVQQKFPV